MRSILIICLASVAIAAPQYSYQQGGGGISTGGLQSTYTNVGSQYSQTGSGVNGFQTFQSAPSFPNVQRVQHHQHRVQQAPLAPIVTKNFFIHSAPEETEEEVQEDIQQLRQSRKHYNVVFIKAPIQASKHTAITLAQALNEEKTVIYVLSKKPDASEIRTVLQQQHYEPKKPEVFFIKYKTPEEAQYAQQQIQAQYDSLGGATQISDEGVAPITSVIGSLGDTGFGSSNVVGQSSQLIGEINNAPGPLVSSSYLPAKHK